MGKEVSDEFWGPSGGRTLLEPLLPEPKRRRIGAGRHRIDDHFVVNAMLLVLTTRCQLKAVESTGLCAPSTVQTLFSNGARVVCFAISG